MSTIPAVQTYVVNLRFERVVKPLRQALAEQELEVAGEIDSPSVPGREDGRSKILLIDSALLDFEALVWDRASAVFFPLHLLISAAGDRTEISLADPSGLFNARLPSGAAEPIGRLLSRVRLALESIVQRCGGSTG